MKLYFMKVGYFLIFIFAILNFLGLKQTEFEIRQLDSTARILTTHAEAVQAAQKQPALNAAAAAALTRADDFPKRRQGNPVGDKDDGRRIDFDRCC